MHRQRRTVRKFDFLFYASTQTQNGGLRFTQVLLRDCRISVKRQTVFDYLLRLVNRV